MLKSTYTPDKKTKKTIIFLIIGVILLLAIVEIGLVVYNHFASNSANTGNFFFKDKMAVYGTLQKDGTMKYGIIDIKGNPVTQCTYDAILPIGEKRIGAAEIKNGEKAYAILSLTGDEITGYEFEELRFYSGKVIAAKQKGKWGYLDTEGKWTIEPQFDSVHSFSEGVASVEKNGKWFFVDKKGNTISKNRFDEAGNLKGGVAKVKKDGKWGYVDVNFNWIVKPRYDMVRNFSGGLADLDLEYRLFADACGNSRRGSPADRERT